MADTECDVHRIGAWYAREPCGCGACNQSVFHVLFECDAQGLHEARAAAAARMRVTGGPEVDGWGRYATAVHLGARASAESNGSRYICYLHQLPLDPAEP